jgi:hypothetical protein
MSPHFKICPFCSKIWPSRDEFLSDDDIILIGYQVDFEELSLGLVLFNHSVCQTTLAIRAGLFRDLYLGPVFSERRTGQTDCPGHCLKRKKLCACPAECECAWVRELLPIIRSWPKSGAASKTAIGRAAGRR